MSTDKWDEIAAGCWLKCKAAFRQWWKVEEYDQQTVVSIFAAAFREQFRWLSDEAAGFEKRWRDCQAKLAEVEKDAAQISKEYESMFTTLGEVLAERDKLQAEVAATEDQVYAERHKVVEAERKINASTP